MKRKIGGVFILWIGVLGWLIDYVKVMQVSVWDDEKVLKVYGHTNM